MTLFQDGEGMPLQVERIEMPSTVSYEAPAGGELFSLRITCHGRVVARLTLARRPASCEINLGGDGEWKPGLRCGDHLPLPEVARAEEQPSPFDSIRFSDIYYPCAACSDSTWRLLPGTRGSERLHGDEPSERGAVYAPTNRRPSTDRDGAEQGIRERWVLRCRHPGCNLTSVPLTELTAQGVAAALADRGVMKVELSTLRRAAASWKRSDHGSQR